MQTHKGSPFPFGPTYHKDGINFALFAKDLEKISLCFFNLQDLNTPFFEFELTPNQNKTGEIWHALLTELPASFAYAYRLTLTEDKNNSRLILDPYAKCVTSTHEWHDPSKENNYHPLGKWVEHEFDWEGDTRPNIQKKDLVIYEMHVRGFTHHASSQTKNPGTYNGILEKIPYLLDLGVNAVELMPIHEFNEADVLQVNPDTKQKLYNYFGYSTVNFFSPMNRYANDINQDSTFRDLKNLIKELHKNKIEVILDVVFNHTFEGNEQGPILSFKALDPQVFYIINDEKKHMNFSGCGNTFNCNHPITQEFICSVLRYWVLEFHIDGFRFDLASIFNRGKDGAPLEKAPLLEFISEDPLLANTKLIAEPWDPGGLYQLGKFAQYSPRWSEWNGKYQNTVRRFIKGTPLQKNLFAGAIAGSHDLYNRSPYSSINYIVTHDGFTLADLVSYNEKHNLANGENNNDGLSNNDSWNCGFEGATNNKKVLNLRKKQMRNLHLALMVSQGIPMIFMGDEYGHTRNGNNNPWCQDNELNWFLWNRLAEEQALYRFYKSLIHFRKNHALLRLDNFLDEKIVKWHGLNVDQPEWDKDNHFVAFSLHYPSSQPGLYIAFNASHIYQNINIPPVGEGKTWNWVVNTNNAPPEDFFDLTQHKPLTENILRMAPYSSIMLMCPE